MLRIQPTMFGSRFSLAIFLLAILNIQYSFTFDENETEFSTIEPEYITDYYDKTDEPIPEEPEEPDDPNFIYTGCGKKSFSYELSNRVKGGENAKQKDWPWHAQINTMYFEKGNNSLVMNIDDSCGASLINEIWALTAAHCVHRDTPPNSEPRSIDVQFSLAFGDRKSPNGTVVRSSKQIFVHPYYEFGVSQARFDIALVLLNESVRFTSKIVPVCLPEVDLELSGHTVYLTGRGFQVDKDGNFWRNRILQQVKMRILHNSECLEMAKDDEFCTHCPPLLRTDNMLCAGLPDGSVSATHGDSGGPLVLEQYDGTYTQVGVVSTGHLMYKFGIFTSVAKNLWWIHKILRAHTPLDMDDDGY